MTRRQRYAQAAVRLGGPAALDRILGPHRLTAVAYHRIGMDVGGRREPWDPDLISATPEEFGRQLDVVRRNFQVVSLDDLAAFITRGAELPPRAALITFDDGYRDNYELALPELRARSLPGVVFLVSGAMGTATPMWWDLIAYATDLAQPGVVDLPGVGRVSLTGRNERAQARRRLGAALKRMDTSERDAAVDVVFLTLDLERPSSGLPFMTWDEARECQRAGFACQAHTVTHPILTRTSVESARREITTSVDDVGAETGARQLAFAYPNGGPSDVDPSLYPAFSASGIVMAFMLDGGPAPYSAVRSEPFRIARIPIYSGDSGNLFRLKLFGAARVVQSARALRPTRRRFPQSVPEPVDVSASSARTERERAFWDNAHGGDARARQAKYYAVARDRISSYEALLREKGAGRHSLEIGCATGTRSIELARCGGTAVGIDVSPVAVAEARRRATEAGLSERARFEVMDAAELEFEDASFDLVFASGAVHHLPVERSIAEAARVLRPNGTMVMTEPLSGNPLIGAYRRLTPDARSPDERPLTPADLELISEYFEEVDTRWYHVTSLAAVPFRRTPAFPALLEALETVDSALFRLAPLSRRWAWYALVVARGPRSDPRAAS